MNLIATTVRGLAVAGLAGTSLMLVAPAAQARSATDCAAGGVSKTVVDGVITYRNDPNCGVDPNRGGTKPPAPKPPKPPVNGERACLPGLIGDIACDRTPGGRSVYLVPGGTVTVGPIVTVNPGGGSTVTPTVTVGPTSNPDKDNDKKPSTSDK